MYRVIENVLKRWQKQKNRLPLLLRGARQVGKSFIVEKFGRENFESTVIVNFEFTPKIALCFETLDPIVICRKLEIVFNISIIPGKTLLFLDEIQNCPNAIMALRYFKEKMPDLHVIAAGSLLEFILHEERFSFPVGRIQFLYLKPLSFQEFLLSQHQDKLVEFLNNVTLESPPDPFFHETLMNFVKQYFLLGGMPSVVKCFQETQSFLECQTILTGLLETYRSDFSKYATKTQHQYLQLLFDKAPGLVGNHFKYTLVSREYRSSDLKIALEQLGWAGLLQRVEATSASGIPLSIHRKEQKFKLLFLDLGLVNRATRLDLESVWTHQLLQINAGSLAEQFVGQELLAYADPYANEQLFYWERDKTGSMAEVDYVMQYGPLIIPIEVKAGTTGSLRSIKQFLIEKKQPFGIRISQHPLSFHDQVLSIPLYLISQIERLVSKLS